MKNITILGATGSIGDSTLAVIDLHPDKFKVFAVSANTNWQKMLKLCQKYQPCYAAMANEEAAEKLQNALNSDTQVLAGKQALCDLAEHPKTDYVMAAIVGAAGIKSTLSAAKAGKRIMLANKESLVSAGDIFIKTVAAFGAELIPVDSEHSAIFQCLQNGKSGLSKIQLTASGGPFLHKSINELQSITPDMACNHPNWKMGRKISVDSATMMNKGLEVIEAHYLFALKPEQIEVLIHPQSIVHSSVYYQDGNTLSQLANPDMRSIIAYALAYPQRIRSGVKALDLSQQSPLEFYPPDFTKFPCLQLAFTALKKGGSAMATLNAANEVAVAAFLSHKIDFLQISQIIEQTLNIAKHKTLTRLDEVLEHDIEARHIADDIIKNNYSKQTHRQ